MLGTYDFIDNPQPFETPSSKSLFVPDYVINPHPRFGALTRNIRSRRQEKVNIRIPLYKDVNTPEFNRDRDLSSTFPEGFKPEDGEDIYMDCMAFGMGMCCLQVTFQARDVDESRYMYE